MSAAIMERQENTVTIQVSIKLTRSMLDTEEAIQQALNEAGVLASTEALKQFDTDGSPLEIGDQRWTSKGQLPKTYQTPYGEAVVERHVYQTGEGGATFCPLERDARIILTATPRFAKQVSSKYADRAGGRVVEDLDQNHGRRVSLCLVQDLADAVGSVALAKEEDWHYATPKLDVPVATIGMGLDGTCMFMTKEGNRQAMVGTISLYDAAGERLHTIYTAATPEYGKATFYARLARAIEHTCGLFPKAKRVGVADGSEDNWTFLKPFTDENCVDFYHATGYVRGASRAACPDGFEKREEWVDKMCHRLKHEVGAAKAIVKELAAVPQEGLSGIVLEGLQKAITYFTNHHEQMRYAEHEAANWPIGSGVTEAACKTLVKMRLCKSGAKWKEQGAAIVLSIRSLAYTDGRWEQFWAKVDRYGFPIALAA
jgi:hypothetical protein